MQPAEQGARLAPELAQLDPRIGQPMERLAEEGRRGAGPEPHGGEAHALVAGDQERPRHHPDDGDPGRAGAAGLEQDVDATVGENAMGVERAGGGCSR